MEVTVRASESKPFKPTAVCAHCEVCDYDGYQLPVPKWFFARYSKIDQTRVCEHALVLGGRVQKGDF